MKTIRDYASRILQLFVDCDRYSTGESILPFEDRHRPIISDFQGRFRSWCGFLGALQVGHASLDWRLRDSKNLSQSVISHLGGLIDDLEDYLDVLSPERQALDEHEHQSETTSDSGNSSSTDEPPDSATELNQHLLSLKCTLDNLYKLSFLIRNQKSRQSTLRKAESYGINFDGHGGDSFQHLQPGHHDRAAEFIRQLREEGGCLHSSNSPDHDATLLDRLCHASSKRQRQFAYWEDHSRKLSAEVPSGPPKQAQTEGVLDLSHLATGPGTIFSGTEATSIQVVDHDTQSLAPSASTARGPDGTRVPLPKAPKLNDGQAEFQCPYCHVWCPVSERRRWRKHLFEDLRPYMCTYLDCPTANDLFSNRAEWLAHEKGFHLSVWKCRYHPSTMHKSQKEFEDHLRSQHASMTDREIEASVKYSMTTLKDTREYCCMCLVTVSQLPRGQSLTNHMAHHFETFARPSLPDRGGEDDDMESEDDESVSADGEGPVVQQDADIDMPIITSDDFEDAAHPGEDMSIHALAVDGNKYGMRVLLEQQPDLNARDDEGWTALQRAAYAGQSTVLQMLLEAGADVRYSSGYYGNALQCAALQGHEELTRSLIEGGANVNQQGGYHGTALLAAACQGHETTVEILLEAGARVDLPNDRHISATNGAIQYGHIKLAHRLDLKAKDQRAGGQEIVSNIDELAISPQASSSQIWPQQQSDAGLSHGFDPETQVHSLVQRAAPEIVTPPGVLAEGITAHSRLLGTQSGDHEKLDPSFLIRPKGFYSVGRVFKVLWAEPAGANATVVTRNTFDNLLGERVHAKVRWFVVIREGTNYCCALPVTTYGGQGVAKPGVVKSEHGIIYTGRNAPSPSQAELATRPNEARMRSEPIRVDPDSPLDRLDSMSRINFAAVSTVQHNIKVKSVGKVNRDSIRSLQQHFQNVWSATGSSRTPTTQPRQTLGEDQALSKVTSGTGQTTHQPAEPSRVHPPYTRPQSGSSRYGRNNIGEPRDTSNNNKGATVRPLQPNIARDPNPLPWQHSASLGSEYLWNPRTDQIVLTNGMRIARPRNIPRDSLQSAAYDGPLPQLPALQPQHVPQTQNFQLDRGRGQPSRPNQIQWRTQPVDSGMSQPAEAMANTNLAPGASNPAASSVQTRRFQQNDAVLQQSIDRNTGVQVILQNTPPTPRNLQAEGIVLQRSLVGTTGNAERLFPEYTVRPSRFFCLGRVFLVLWAEPAGGNGSNAGTVVTMQEQGTVLNHLGERVFSKVRRFVVIRESDQYCNALPITTYSGRGVANRNVVKSEHAIIYTGSAPPQPQPDEQPSRGETGMRPQSIRVDPDKQTDRLDPMSRINFGGVFQIQHNIKTKSLGVVNRQSIDALQSQFRNVWQDQLRSQTKPAAGRSQAQGPQRTADAAGALAGALGDTGSGVVASGIPKAFSDGSDDGDDEEEDAEEDSADGGTEDEDGTSEVDTGDK